ncbi:NUDIX hydrolase [Siphonobacter aquaeclarae]|nr:CoA pyrophosphatase [Siphonobacter aquaeclarae]
MLRTNMNITTASFTEFSEALVRRLQQPLPGETAHQTMATGSRVRFKVQPNERTRQSAVLILFYPYKGEIILPLILRPKYEGVHGGQMAFPGGRMERTDKSLIHTALREAQEEIGIKASDVKVLGSLTKLFIPPSNFWVLPVVGTLNYRPDFYPDPIEVDMIFEVGLQEMMDRGILGTEQREARGVIFDAPYYLLQENKVWGATAMMIAELLAVVAGSE